MGLPRWLGGKEPTCQCRRLRRHGFDCWVREDPLEEEMASHCNILACRIPWTEEPGWPQSTGSKRVRHDWVTECMCTYTHTYMLAHTRTHTHTQSVCGIVYLSSHYGKQCEVFSKKLKTELPYDPAISLLGIYQKKTNTLIWRYIHPNAHSSIIYNSQGMEAT